MDKLDMLDCLYASFAEKNAGNRESYKAVFTEYLENIYNQLHGNQEEITKGLCVVIQDKIEKQNKYSSYDKCLICIMAGRILQELIERECNV